MSGIEGPIFQICWVVADIDAAERFFTEHLGVSQWLRMPGVTFGPEQATYRGEPADYTIHVSLGYAGAQQLELIQPVSGASLYAEHLAEHGPGLHHVAWLPADYAAAVSGARVPVIQQGDLGDELGFAYLDGGPIGSPVELMRLGPHMRAMFDALVPEAYRAAASAAPGGDGGAEAYR